MLIKEIKYCYNDVAIVPTKVSSVEHREECTPFHEDGFLPIFTAPMSTVVSEENYELFEDNKIHAILPRNIDFETRLKYALNNKWAAFSLSEFENFFCDDKYAKHYVKHKKKVLVDIANGHMKKLYTLAKRAKRIYGESLQLMIGNIANPKTYEEVVKCGADYVRLSIGSGQGCITSSNVAVHFPLASLIEETCAIKHQIAKDKGIPMSDMPKIIADGGVRNYSDVIKALALGADYVMIGSVLAQLVESAAKTFFINSKTDEYVTYNPMKDNIVEDNGIFIINDRQYVGNLYKIFYGMASKEGQIDISGIKTKTAEGIVKTLPCTTNLSKWSENMTSYIRSAMSYTDIKNVYDLNKVTLILISDKTKDSINK